MEFDELSNTIIRCALNVHSALGPGLFEEVYKTCLKRELEKANVKVSVEVPIPVNYDGFSLEIGYRADLIVDNRIIVELKSVQKLGELHKAQLLTYLKLAKQRVGLLFNFNTSHLRDGIFRMVNEF